MRLRLQTLMIAVVIIGLLTGLLVQGYRAGQREAALRARLKVVEKQRDIERLAVQELDTIRQQELSQLRSQFDRASRRTPDPAVTEPTLDDRR